MSPLELIFFSCCRQGNYLFKEQTWAIKNIWKYFWIFVSKKLKLLDENKLRECCAHVHSIFSHGHLSYVYLEDFFSEMKVLLMTLPTSLVSTIEILEFVKVAYCYPKF